MYGVAAGLLPWDGGAPWSGRWPACAAGAETASSAAAPTATAARRAGVILAPCEINCLSQRLGMSGADLPSPRGGATDRL
ncbi:hypothetical protein GCM10020227_03060 [Streptomyces flavovirens]